MINFKQLFFGLLTYLAWYFSLCNELVMTQWTMPARCPTPSNDWSGVVTAGKPMTNHGSVGTAPHAPETSTRICLHGMPSCHHGILGDQ